MDKSLNEIVNRVIQGDCLDVMKQIPDKSVDMILCDLPYGTTACSWDTIIPFEPLWSAYKRIIKDNGAIVLTASQPFTSKLVMSNINMFKYCWVWDKVSIGNPQLAKIQPLKHHEDIIVFAKGRVNYHPITKKINQDSKELLQVAAPKQYKRTKEQLGHIQRRKDYKQIDTGYPKSIIKYARPSGAIHPTQKPVPLFEYLIKTYTDEGDTVLDNCAGSFTTAIAAIKTNRNWICIEKGGKHCDIGRQRIKQELSQGDMFRTVDYD